MIAKARAEARAAEAKKKKIKEATQIEKFNTLTPNREIHKDSHRMQDKKRIKEGLPFGVTPDMVSDVLKVLAGMGAIAGGSVAITKWHDLLKKKSPELFNKLASIRSTAGAANDALNLENKKKKVEEKKKY
jgi:hypothetical protein